MNEHFERYIDKLYNNIPNEVFELGLISFCIGVLGVFVLGGWKNGWRIVTGLLLTEYVGLIYCSTVFFRKVKDGVGHDFRPFWSYEAIRNGKTFFIVEDVMNMVVFVPVGILLGVMVNGARLTVMKELPIALMVGMSISLSIETMQYFFHRGFAETDDVIHNTMGCIIGYMLVKGSRFIVKKQ